MGELSFAFSGQLPQIILTGFFFRSHVKFGFCHKILNIFGAGVSDGEMLDSYPLAHFLASHVEDGAHDVPRKVVASVLEVQEYPVYRFVLEKSGVGRGWRGCWG